MGTFYPAAPEPKGERYRPLFVAGLVVVMIGAAAAYLAMQAPKQPAELKVDPYAESLILSEVHMSQAQNFVGGQVTYIEGKVNNIGGKTVSAVNVEAVFRNSLGQVVDKPVEPMRVQQMQLGNPDFVPLSAAPLTPNASREFRLAIEHVSADWNQGMPEVRIVKVEGK